MNAVQALGAQPLSALSAGTIVFPQAEFPESHGAVK
jgi:hypothetical protein